MNQTIKYLRKMFNSAERDARRVQKTIATDQRAYYRSITKQ